MKKIWFDFERFGMFIHWGVYAGAYGNEWIKSDNKLTDVQYQRYVDNFEPDLFAPDEWAEIAQNAGMKYVVFTAKHHDGFCMYDSACTDYNSMKYYGRDFLREILEAFRKRNFKVGVYYSLPDWHHPNYMIDARHPLRDFPEERDTLVYTRYLHEQVRELMSNYGKIDMLWFDGSYPETKFIWHSEELREKILELQPEIIIARLPGCSDFTTPEQCIPTEGVRDEKSVLLRWEGCQVINGQWGYSTLNNHWWTPRQLVEMLVKHVSRGGNMLLNVPPTGRGAVDGRTAGILKEVGTWMRLHERAIDHCTKAPDEFPEPENCRYTYNPETRRLYLFCFAWSQKEILLKNLDGKVQYVRFLHDHSEIPNLFHDEKNVNTLRIPAGVLKLNLPTEPPDVLLPVVELILKK